MASHHVYFFVFIFVTVLAGTLKPPHDINISINGSNVTFTWSLPSTHITYTYLELSVKENNGFKNLNDRGGYLLFPTSSYNVNLQSCNEYRLQIQSVFKKIRSDMANKRFWITDNTLKADINTDVNVTWTTTLKKFYDVITPYGTVSDPSEGNPDVNKLHSMKYTIYFENNTIIMLVAKLNSSDAGIYKTVDRIKPVTNGCSFLIIKDKPEKPTLKFDSHPFVDLPTVFTCTSKVQRWPKWIDSSIYYNFSVKGEQQNNNLTVNITRADKDKQIYCWATDDLGRSSDFSDNITIDPYYGPEKTSLEPPGESITVKEGTKLSPIVCNADCNPNCTYQWKRKDESTFTNFMNTATLKIPLINRSDSGMYRCRVDHQKKYPNGTKRFAKMDVNVIVYYSPKFRRLKYSINRSAPTIYVTNIAFNEGQNVEMTIDIESNPVPSLSICSSDYQPICINYSRTNELYTFPPLMCEQSNNYTITANNSIGQSDNMTIQLIIQCGPKNSYVHPEIIRTQIGRTENITVKVTSNPKPTVEWTNITSQVWSVIDTGLKYTYIFFSAVNISDEFMFGQYGLKICNTLWCRTRTISVTPKDKPQQPRNLNFTEISSNWANISWEAGFDGGDRQSFTIMYRGYNKNTWTKVDTYSSSYTIKGAQQFYTLTGLLPKTLYDIIVLANNSFGTSNASLHLMTNAAPDLTTSAGHNRYIFIGAGGGVLGLIICIGIVAVLLKRRQNVTKEKNVTYVKDVRQSEQRLTQENSPEPENTEYAVVVKQKSNNESQNVQDNSQTAEYAAIVKPKSKKASSKVKFVNTEYAVVEKSNQHNDVTEETEYANEGDQQLHLQNIGRKQNKEGLIYLEVTFSNDPSNRPVVRDPYQKTDYVDIDFTRKAEMLPEDSE